MTVHHQDVSALQLGSDLNQFTFMELMLESFQSPLYFIKLEEYNVECYEAVKVAVSFNEVLDYSDELTHFIIQSVKVNELKRQDEADAVVENFKKYCVGIRSKKRGSFIALRID